MKKLLTTACLFVVTTIAIVSFIAPSFFGQEKKTASVNPSPAKSVTARVDKLFAQWDKPDSPGCALGSGPRPVVPVVEQQIAAAGLEDWKEGIWR
ncbi:MAG: hypothetical protein H0U60_08335 [Blastocatellia bacterium]|nr:hypothetical protein [Blastocatellia bacterium]